MLLLIIILIIWFTPLLNIEYSNSIVKANEKVIDEIALRYAKRDVNNYFKKLIFLQMYNDVIYISNKKKLKIDDKKPIIMQFDNKKYKEIVKKIKKLKETVKNFNNSKYLSEMYVYPVNNKGYMYKIDTQTFDVYFINSKIVKKLNNNPKFLRFDFNLRSLYFKRKELLSVYKRDLLKIFNLSHKVNNEINKAIKNYLENKIYIAKWILSALILFGFIIMEILIKMYRDSKKKILNKIERLKKEKREYETISHYSQHDIKTNSRIILDNLFYVYLKIQSEEKEEAIKILAELNLLEYTILKANSYSKNDRNATDQYRLHKDISDENFIKFFKESLLEKKLLEVAKKNIFEKVTIDINDIEEHTINLKEKKFYQNELSLVFFKLLNNAIKHRKKDSKIDVYIGKDNEGKFMLKITNEIIDDENCKDAKAKIENSLKSNSSHNMSVIRQILQKYGLELKINCKDEDKKLEAKIQIKKE